MDLPEYDIQSVRVRFHEDTDAVNVFIVRDMLQYVLNILLILFNTARVANTRSV